MGSFQETEKYCTRLGGHVVSISSELEYYTIGDTIGKLKSHRPLFQSRL